ncbi:MAG: AIPR family protein [Clostridia bacterium]|nr:AIPR family protein [Clostridia bacterium]
MPLQFIESELNKFRAKYPFLEKVTREHLFGTLCSSFFFFDGELKQSEFDSMFTDGKNDGEFDFIFNEDQSDANDLILVQSKMTEDLNKDKILSLLEKMHRTYVELQNGHYEKYNDRVKSAFINSTDRKGDAANNYFVLFTLYNPKDKTKGEIESAIHKAPNLKKYKIAIYYLDDIVNQIQAVNNPTDYIEYGKIQFYKTHGIVKLDNAMGAVVNISAVDLKRLYAAYASKGLFNRNLRFYIKQKKVDDGIVNSLKTKREQFWFMNNGIIIGCEDYSIDGVEIKLTKFSIINGAQTTSLIGESQYVEKSTDFPIVCKIIKYTSEEFISAVAEASNSQKPINERDLIANRYEQKKLKDDLLALKPPVYMEIKRGEKKPSKAKFPEPWQRIKNEDLGQLLLSIAFQRPGTARSNKKTMFSVETTYDLVFRRQHDYQTIIDMLKLKTIYEQYLEKKIDTLEKTQKGIANNGKFCILALIGLLLKNERGLFSKEDITTIVNADAKKVKDIIGKDDLSGTLLTSSYDISKIEDLIYELIEKVSDKYGIEEEAGKTTSYSNFLKTDLTYQTIIVPTIMKMYYNKERFKKNIQDDLSAFRLK